MVARIDAAIKELEKMTDPKIPAWLTAPGKSAGGGAE